MMGIAALNPSYKRKLRRSGVGWVERSDTHRAWCGNAPTNHRTYYSVYERRLVLRCFLKRGVSGAVLAVPYRAGPNAILWGGKALQAHLSFLPGIYYRQFGDGSLAVLTCHHYVATSSDEKG
jgi:hypothetical protein